ncbi:DUF3408 domain-containing protein [Bacteroides caccae]|uniref:DUF3408 domain-containing protein n=1 Tax=Bacteroides caccae TaxID=47678 RepID=A0A6L3KTS8_9BACE|nr:DUF3408 domain-containing protein [Bacteroides caccae]KAA5443496.1 DUF3408 domain-containing protein [Bacteroides caccae]KAA5463794.1 DUF3408 domain-containing protein [Bacteroides caccae]
MAKKRNYENDEAFKNFRVQDYLPEMKWRDPETKTSVQEQGVLTEEATLFPPEPGAFAAQAAVSETPQPNEQEVWEDDVETGDTDNDKIEETALKADASEERTIVRRISGKQRRLSLEEYRTAYLQVPKITNRKPVFLSGTVRDRLDEIVRRLGGRGLSVSGLVENLARQHLIAYGDDIAQWRKL